MRIMHHDFACLRIKYIRTVQLPTNANLRLRDVSLGKSSISESKPSSFLELYFFQ